MGLANKNKKEYNYFECFEKGGEAICQSAEMLVKTVSDMQNISKYAEEIHVIEHGADSLYHEMMGFLTRAFITPFEREDLKMLGQSIDDVVDAIDETVINLYIYDITTLRDEAAPFVDLLSQCCQTLNKVLHEFKHYKKSKDIKKYIIEVNDIEEKADQLFQTALRRLFTSGTPEIEIIKWREIFKDFERCVDACEEVADTVEIVILKNS